MRVACYTVVFGGYDRVRTPKCRPQGVDFFCFSDREPNCPGWDWIRHMPEGDPVLENRLLKMRPELILGDEYDYSVYVDASVEIISDFSFMIKAVGDGGVAAFKHRFRESVYEEAEYCIRRGKGDPELIARQMGEYRRSGLPLDTVLSENGVLIRNQSSPIVKRINSSWWEEYSRYPTRDQLSLPYVLWKEGASCGFLPGTIEENRCFFLWPHSFNGVVSKVKRHIKRFVKRFA